MSNPTKDAAIIVQDLSKSFKIPIERSNGFKQALINITRRKRGYRKFRALDDISFEIKKGEFFGIVGRNGSGKSTLLKLIAGIYVPNKGGVQVNGTLTPFIELGVGFNPELTGRENVFLNGALLGFGRREMEDMYDEIVEFAELEDFMEERLKNYSSGMQVRLAFSIAIRARSDILLLDEVLAVGDAVFQKKCYEYFRKLKADKQTVILVSHDANILEEYCDSGILIEDGKIIEEGPIRKVISKYIGIISRTNNDNHRAAALERSKEHVGSGEMIITSAASDIARLTQDDKDIKVTIVAESKEGLSDVVAGITILNDQEQPIFASNNIWLKQRIDSVRAGQKLKVTWIIPNIFNNGIHTVTPTISTDRGRNIVDQIDSAVVFEVQKKIPNGSYTNPSHEMKIELKD
jgi:ABC-2 type transport system ATP-binding protein